MVPAQFLYRIPFVPTMLPAGTVLAISKVSPEKDLEHATGGNRSAIPSQRLNGILGIWDGGFPSPASITI